MIDPAIANFLAGDIQSPTWRAMARDMLTKISDGPFDVTRCATEPLACITNANLEVLAKTGPITDGRSCFDAMFLAAAANAVRRMLEAEVA